MEWIDCRERMPDKNGLCIIFCGYAVRFAKFSVSKNGFVNRKGNLTEEFKLLKVKYWMPLDWMLSGADIPWTDYAKASPNKYALFVITDGKSFKLARFCTERNRFMGQQNNPICLRLFPIQRWVRYMDLHAVLEKGTPKSSDFNPQNEPIFMLNLNTQGQAALLKNKMQTLGDIHRFGIENLSSLDGIGEHTALDIRRKMLERGFLVTENIDV